MESFLVRSLNLISVLNIGGGGGILGSLATSLEGIS
jgi:hypothetical protein